MQADIKNSIEEAAADRQTFEVPWIWAAWGLLVGVAMALRPILPVDETRYASVAWEMWRSGDLLVPHLNGLPYSDKPPLLFWLIHLGWWAFGVSDWWLRLVPAVFGLANLVLARSLAARLWPDRPAVARRTPAVLVGFLVWSVYTTFLLFDMLVACFVLVALHGLLTARERGGLAGLAGWAGCLQVGLALGLGVLSKGPVALVVPAGAALLAAWWDRSRLHGPRWWLGLLVALGTAAAVALAWAVPAAMAGGPAYAEAIFFSQTEERLVYAVAHGRPWWWYLALLPVLIFPYSVWVPAWRAVLRLRRGGMSTGTRGAGTVEGERFCLAWLLPGLMVFSLISGKQPHYLVPLLPALALLIARALDEPAPAVRPWHLAPPLAVLVLLGVALETPWTARRFGPPQWADMVAPGVGLAFLGLAVAFVLSFERLFVGRRSAGPVVLTLALVTGLHVAFAGLAEEAYDLEPIARYVRVLERQGRPIAFVGPYHGQLHFLGRLERPFTIVAPGAELLWAQRHPRGRVIQDLDYVPDLVRADFVQPYRDDVLAIWGQEPPPSAPPSG